MPRSSLLTWLAVLSAGGAVSWPAVAGACTYVELPPKVNAPRNGSTAVPTNTQVHAFFDLMYDRTAAAQSRLTLERPLADAGRETVPVAYELLPFNSQYASALRLEPLAELLPDTRYEVRFPRGYVDGGWVNTGVTLSTFITGSGPDSDPPPRLNGFRFAVDSAPISDAGWNLYCGPISWEVLRVHPQAPDSGEEVLFFARSGDGGVFNGALGQGFGICGVGDGPIYQWSVVPGQRVTLWSEDLAGNASAPVELVVELDCDGGSTGRPTGPGCGCSGGSPPAALLILALALRRRSPPRAHS